MSSVLQPWHILLAAVCGLLNQRQQHIIEFQNAQIEALLKQLGKKRPLLKDVLTQMPRGASLESLLPHTWLQTHPEHRWTIAERRKLEHQRCSND